MEPSDSSTQVNVGSEEVDDELNRPSTSKQHFNTGDNSQESPDVIVVDDDDDDDDVICDLMLDDSKVDLLEDDDLCIVQNCESTANASFVMDVPKLQTFVKDSAELELLFKNHLMEPLTFLLLLHDFALELKLTKLIEDCGGVVYSTVSDIDGHTIVMVKDDSLHWSYLGAVFKVSYVQACIETKKVLDISRYFKSSVKIKLKNNFNFMSIVYFKKYSWDNIPEKYTSPKKLPLSSLNRSRSEKSLCSNTTWTSNKNSEMLSSDEEEISDSELMPPPPPPPRQMPKIVNKHTRLLYSRKEDEAILKYIVHKEGYDNLKGNMFWKKLENRNICPSRTWQSVKEHFLKKIVYNLNSFQFLTEKQIELIQVCAIRKY